MTRAQEIAYAAARGIPVAADRWSTRTARTRTCGAARSPAACSRIPGRSRPRTCSSSRAASSTDPATPAYVELTFEAGVPVALNGVPDAARRAPRHRRDDCRPPRRRPDRHGREPAARHQVARDPRGAGRRRAPRRAPRPAGVRHDARARSRLRVTSAPPTPTWCTTASGSRDARRAMDAFVAAVQQRVTGDVRVKLFRGDCQVVGRRSPYAVYDPGLSTYGDGDRFDHSAAEGFIRIWGLPVETSARTAARRRPAGVNPRRVGRQTSRMSHLWSGRFDTAPDRRRVRLRRLVPLRSPPVRRRRHRQPRVGARRSRDAGVLSADGCATPIDGGARPRSSSAGAATRRSSPGPTRTCTASSSGSWSSASAMPAAACTPAARATSRCRSICACTCGGASRCCSRRSSASIARAARDQAERRGDALMPAYTHLRRAQPVLVAHFFLAHAAALRRDHARLGGAARGSRCAAARVGRDCRHQLRRSTPPRSRARSASRASSPTASTRRRIATSWRRSSTPAR